MTNIVRPITISPMEPQTIISAYRGKVFVLLESIVLYEELFTLVDLLSVYLSVLLNMVFSPV